MVYWLGRCGGWEVSSKRKTMLQWKERRLCNNVLTACCKSARNTCTTSTTNLSGN